MIITINNYDYYQNPKNYESHNESHNRTTTEPQGTDTINKKKKNKEEKEINIYAEQFENFRKFYPGTKRGLETELSNFKKKHKDWKEVIPLLPGIIEKQIRHKEKLKRLGRFVPEWKNLQTWINQRCWEEEIKEVNQKPEFQQ